MLIKILSALKPWSLAILICYVAALTFGSLGSADKMPELGSSFDDKIYHLIAYGVFTLLVYNYFSFKGVNYKIYYTAAAVILYGIIIEVLQYALTTNRTLDAFDVLANSLGVLIASVALLVRQQMKLKMSA